MLYFVSISNFIGLQLTPAFWQHAIVPWMRNDYIYLYIFLHVIQLFKT